MGTLAALKARIASDLVRDDLTTQIGYAIDDAIRQRESERFWFNTSRSLTFSTVATQVAYGTSDNARIPYLIKIDGLFLTYGTAIYPLTRRDAAMFENMSGGTSTSGRPTDYCWIDDTIRLWPTPDAVYSLRLHAHYKLAALTGDSDSNAWTTEAVELIRETAKAFLFADPLRDMEGMNIANGKSELAMNNLRAETSARLGTGIIQGTQF